MGFEPRSKDHKFDAYQIGHGVFCAGCASNNKQLMCCYASLVLPNLAKSIWQTETEKRETLIVPLTGKFLGEMKWDRSVLGGGHSPSCCKVLLNLWYNNHLSNDIPKDLTSVCRIHKIVIKMCMLYWCIYVQMQSWAAGDVTSMVS